MANLFALTFLLSLLALPIGLANPKLFQNLAKRLLSSDATRKNVSIGLLTTALVSFIGIGITAPRQSTVNPLENSVAGANVLEAFEGLAEESVVDEANITEEINAVEEPKPVEETKSTTTPTAEPEVKTQVLPQAETEPEPEPVYEPTPTPTPAPAAPTYQCGGDYYNCGDFSTHNQAQAVHDYCKAQGYGDIHGLDGNDNDGLACESLP